MGGESKKGAKPIAFSTAKPLKTANLKLAPSRVDKRRGRILLRREKVRRNRGTGESLYRV